jgi:hypothetical protein
MSSVHVKARVSPTGLVLGICLNVTESFIHITPRRKLARSEHGLTTTELVAALALLGIVLAMGVSGFRGALKREQIDGWARAMTYDLAAGRRAAITERSTVTVTVTSTSYSVAVSGGPTLRYAGMPSDITLTTTCPSNVCSFGREGTPTGTGTITLTSAYTGRQYTVTIQSGTGRVSYQ